MIDALPELLGIGQGALWHGFIVFLRIGAMMAFLPAFGEQYVPMRLRLGLALAFTLIVAPAVILPDALIGLGQALAEVVTGLFFGLLLRLFVMALQIAGSIAAQSTSLSQLFGGSAGSDPQPAMGHVLVIAGLALAATMGLHVRIAQYMIQGYDLVPLGRLIPPDLLSRTGLAEVSRCFALGFTLAAPFVVASLIYNVTLGVINKAMPQLMVAFVGAPAITAGGLILLMISAPIILSVWAGRFSQFMAVPLAGAP